MACTGFDLEEKDEPMSAINDLLDKLTREIDRRGRAAVAEQEYEPVKLRNDELLTIYRALQAMSAIRELMKE
jgi:hypothetical protein